MMVIGVVMILIALIAPTIGRSMEAARDAKRQAALSSSMKIVTIYAAQYKDVAPIAVSSTEENLWRWREAVKAAGLIETWKDIDPEIPTDKTYSIYHLNRAFFDRVEDMTPGQTEPTNWAQCDPVRLGSVVFPDRLIMIAYYWKVTSEDPWCCLTHKRTYPAPVVFADGHIEVGYWTDFVAEDELFVENNVGWPAASTWFGHRGRSK
jgi:hypothetical protein